MILGSIITPLEEERDMLILGIETSCDDTGVALYDTQKGLLAHVRRSQDSTHAPFGGVVPELAAREHAFRLAAMADALAAETGISLTQLDAISYTAGPGLAGSLLVGATFAHALALSLSIPVLGINHLEAHLASPFLGPRPLDFPFLALLVSGGHTLLAKVEERGRCQVLGETLDDAAGEAFDKAGQILGLGYPGGPRVAQAARQGQAPPLPRPLAAQGLDFSFSGLKTALLLAAKKLSPLTPERVGALAHEFQEAAVDVLVAKSLMALEITGLKTLAVTGGVSANRRLRERFDAALGERVYFPPLEFCTDNGAMVALAGARRLQKGECSSILAIRPRWPLEELLCEASPS